MFQLQFVVLMFFKCIIIKIKIMQNEKRAELKPDFNLA